jgi:hypothetical protein
LDVSFRSPHNHERILHIHSIHSLLHLNCGYRVGAPQIPVLQRPKVKHVNPPSFGTRRGCKRTFTVLSQLPVARIPPVGASIHRAHLIGASWAPTWLLWPVDTSNIRAALSAPAEKSLDPSLPFQHRSRTGPSWAYIALPCVCPDGPTSYIRTWVHNVSADVLTSFVAGDGYIVVPGANSKIVTRRRI